MQTFRIQGSLFKQIVAVIAVGFLLQGFAVAGTADNAIQKWAGEFQPCTISKADQIKEFKWFSEAAKPFRGMKIKAAAEDIKTHFWEREVLSKAFEEITGIHVEHVIIGEGDVVKNIMEQMITGRKLYDVYVNDSDLKGTHLRLNKVVVLSDYMKGEGKNYTDPYLDLDDFLNIEFGKDYEGNLQQLPDQQFANLYWFRYDWFTDPKTKEAFKKQYGYELGVPLNWSAYEDIAKFFTGRKMKNPDGSEVEAYGHLDYALPSPSLQWRFTDSWLGMAGVGSKGIPYGLPIDDWGIRVENKIPVGSMAERGGELNGPAGIYALTKFIEWLKFAPPEASKWDWVNHGPQASKGNIAQDVFCYITWLSADEFHRPGSPVVGKDGRPVWRVAPSPHGDYWEEGMKVGYQDAGSWTIPSNVRGDKRAMAWLWAQFCVSKAVNLKKFLVGGTPIRKSTIFSDYLTKNAYQYGGLIEFYRSPEEKKWTDTGPNVPHYPGLSGLWWTYIAKAVNLEMTPEQAMNALAKAQDDMMEKLKLAKYSPKLNPLKTKEEWYLQPNGPKGPKPRQKPVTVQYDDLINQWKK